MVCKKHYIYKAIFFKSMKYIQIFLIFYLFAIVIIYVSKSEEANDWSPLSRHPNGSRFEVLLFKIILTNSKNFFRYIGMYQVVFV